MKESIGYTVTLNIMIVFITIIVAFLYTGLIYFKSNKASNIITTAIEKYEGYNDFSVKEINTKMISLGYGSHEITCVTSINDKGADSGKCSLVYDKDSTAGKNGYCVYNCYDGEYQYYKIRTNMMFNIPIINDILDIPIYSNTNRLYDFENAPKCTNGCMFDGKCIPSLKC